MDSRLVRHPLGFWTLRDMPDPESLKRYYADKYFQTEKANYRSSYPKEERAWFDIRIERIAAAAEELRGEAPGSLLDVGCGEGFTLAWFAQRNWQVQGVDYGNHGLTAMNPHMLPNLVCGDVMQHLDRFVTDKSRFDIVWLTNVLEHVPDPPALLRRLRALVTPGSGIAVVTVPNDGSEWQEFLYNTGQIPERFWVAIPDHLAYFDADSLRRTAESSGWTCRRMLAEFPIDWYLANPASNYVVDRSTGPGAHAARIAIDSVLSRRPVAEVNRLYEAMATVGMGRQLTALLS